MNPHRNDRDQLLLRYRWGLLTPAEQKLMEAHLAGCEECKSDLRSIEGELTRAFSGTEAAVPGELDANLATAFREGPDSAGQEFPGAAPLVWRPALIASVCFALAVVVSLSVWISSVSLGRISSSGMFSLDGRMMKRDVLLLKKAAVSAYAGSLIRLKDKYTIGMNAGSRLVMKKVSPKAIETGQEAGTIDYKIRKGSCKFQVLTFNACVEVTGTEFSIEIVPEQDLTRVILVEGTVRVRNLSNPAKVRIVTGPAVMLIKLKHPPEVTSSETIAPPGAGTVKSADSGFDSVSQRVYLRNGSIIVGKVIKQENGVTFIETSAGAMRVNARDIDKVEY